MSDVEGREKVEIIERRWTVNVPMHVIAYQSIIDVLVGVCSGSYIFEKIMAEKT